MLLNNIPMELRALPQWLPSGADKAPIDPRTKQRASYTDPNTWVTFEEAVKAGYPNVGFILSPWDPFTIIDLDNKKERPATPEQLERHQKILAAFDSYTEKSVSGRGYHIITKGSVPSGANRDNVELYSAWRYMICTGDVVKNAPIAEYQTWLDVLYSEMKPIQTVELTEHVEIIDDMDLIDMAANAINGDKFNALCAGDMSEYHSQSEADFALLSIIAFYTKSNDQVRRIFRMSPLGKRDKATKDNKYLNTALEKIRAQQPPDVDFTQLIENANKITSKPISETGITVSELIQGVRSNNLQPAPITTSLNPPGLIGELAEYFFQTAVRPVREIALASAIALTAGIAGRSYNISNTGLNQYILLLAGTGTGKDGILAGIESLLSITRQTIPMVDNYMGPSAFASGQAVLRVLDKKPCFLSVLGEFGYTYQHISDPRATSAERLIKKVLLDIYAKSGWSRMLYPSAYSDSEKSTNTVQAPNITFLGESTPDTFFETLDIAHVKDGLLPRFSIIEYTGGRPPRNQNAGCPPSPQLVQRFNDFVTACISITNNHTICPVQQDYESLQLTNAFDEEADNIINTRQSEIDVQLWNRAHLKSLKLAALIAVGTNPYQPLVSADIAAYAISHVRKETNFIAAKFQSGDVGNNGDLKIDFELKRIIETYLTTKESKIISSGVKVALHRAKVIPHNYLCNRTANLSCFKSDKLGATIALKRGIQNLIDAGKLVQVSKQETFSKFNFQGIVYGLTSDWS